MITAPTHRPAAVFTRVVACTLLSAAVFTACGSDGPAAGFVPGNSSAPDPAPTAAPAPEPEPEPAPAPTAAPAPTPGTVPANADADDGSDTNWALIILIIVAGIALLAALIALFSRGDKQQAGEPATNPSQPQASPQVALLSTAQWIHDQLTLELMAANPQQASARWASERSRLDNVAIGAQQQYAAGAGDSWQSLNQITSLLASSLDTNLNLRSQAPQDQQLVSESTDVVNRHRATLQQLLAAMWPLAQR